MNRVGDGWDESRREGSQQTPYFRCGNLTGHEPDSSESSMRHASCVFAGCTRWGVYSGICCLCADMWATWHYHWSSVLVKTGHTRFECFSKENYVIFLHSTGPPCHSPILTQRIPCTCTVYHTLHNHVLPCCTTCETSSLFRPKPTVFPESYRVQFIE